MGSGLAHVAKQVVAEESVSDYQALTRVPGTNCCQQVLGSQGTAFHRG